MQLSLQKLAWGRSRFVQPSENEMCRPRSEFETSAQTGRWRWQWWEIAGGM